MVLTQGWPEGPGTLVYGKGGKPQSGAIPELVPALGVQVAFTDLSWGASQGCNSVANACRLERRSSNQPTAVPPLRGTTSLTPWNLGL